MRAIVFFCLLLEVFGDPPNYTWSTSDSDPISTECLSASCGCCLIQKQMNRVKRNFEHVAGEMNKYLIQSKTALSLTRGRSAFSVSLTNNMLCSVPAVNDQLIIYGNVLLNLGDSYNVQNGIFTVPQSGVYCLTVTIHANATSGATNVASCARLQVNGQVVAAVLSEKNGHDPQDSSTIVVALKLKAGDEVAVLLPNGCVVCNEIQGEHYNTFTGFLLYAN
ncbi:C1q-related factor-like [Paralichthys olivaceus]|uniref:C1q-related factor-like n=1 Tax=Paralichthys olivaceus TaxID=8255 RepID=UPI003751057B